MREEYAEDDPLTQLLEKGVLYSSAPATTYVLKRAMQPTRALTGIPSIIKLRCDDPECRREMLSVRPPDDSDYPFVVGHLKNYTYSCRHCGNVRTTFVLYATYDSDDQATVSLVGRIPKACLSVPDELRSALSARSFDLYLYGNALADRAESRGIGAISYMRRVVENEMNALLDLLIENLEGSTDPEKVEALRVAQQLQGQHSFAEKAKAADTVLPGSFFPGNQNPFSKLHDLCSEGVHNLDDVESCNRFDEANEVFDLLFVRLLQMAETRRVYEDKVKKLRTRRGE